MVKKLFISQPMKGKTDGEILKTRNAAIEKATALIRDEYGPDTEVVVLDSFFQNAPADAKPMWYLAKSIELLAEADVAFFADGWQHNARGCDIENRCAQAYRTPLRIEEWGEVTKMDRDLIDAEKCVIWSRKQEAYGDKATAISGERQDMRSPSFGPFS